MDYDHNSNVNRQISVNKTSDFLGDYSEKHSFSACKISTAIQQHNEQQRLHFKCAICIFINIVDVCNHLSY